jgi:hypothetical protein
VKLALLLVALCVSACGARSELPFARASDAGADGGKDAGPVVCAAPGTPTSTQEPLGRACAFAGSPAPGMAAIVGKELVFVDGQGQTEPVHAFFVDAPGTTPTSGWVTSRGRYVGALLVGYPESAPNSGKQRWEAVLFDVAGNLLARDAFDGGSKGFGPSGIYGDDTGVFVYGYSVPKGTYSEQVGIGSLWASGESTRLPNGLVPLADPSPQGKVAVYEQNDQGWWGPVSWLDLCSGAKLAAHGGQSTVGSYPIGPRIEYLDYQTLTVFDEGPDDVRSLSLADLATSVNNETASPSGWMLLDTEDPYRFLVANPALGQKSAVDLSSLPTGFWLLDPFDAGVYPTGVRVTSDGDVVVPLRNADHASLFLYRAGAWSELGTPVGEVYSATPFGWRGSYLMYAEWQPIVSGWPPPVGPRLDGTSTQLVRPDTNISALVEFAAPSYGYTRDYQASRDGGCVAYFNTYVENTLYVVSAVTGVSTAVDLSAFGNPSWTLASTFIQGEDVVFDTYAY